MAPVQVILPEDHIDAVVYGFLSFIVIIWNKKKRNINDYSRNASIVNTILIMSSYIWTENWVEDMRELCQKVENIHPYIDTAIQRCVEGSVNLPLMFRNLMAYEIEQEYKKWN